MVLMDLAHLQPLVARHPRLTDRGRHIHLLAATPELFAQTPIEDPTTAERYRRVTGYLHHEQRWITSFGGHHHYHRPLSWYIQLLTSNGLAVTGLHQPPTLPSHTKPDSEWTDYERWFATIPTMLAVACRPTRNQST